jgi:TolB-like protein/DNA-binding winged helix-turn-helix (wHTH) protein/Flp pilus assembly protein TadD
MDTSSPIRQRSLTDPFWIDDWCVHPSSHRLTRHGKTVKLEPKAMAVLLYLAERAGETVIRERLEEDVWQQRVVGYDTLNITISKLRKALEDDPRHPRIIETIPKAGYRLIGKIDSPPSEAVPAADVENSTLPLAQAIPAKRQPVSRGLLAGVATLLIAAVVVATAVWLAPWKASPHVPASATRTPADKPSIAVLPFDNLSGDPDQEYFSDGITADLITDLSKISGLTVIARNSTFSYKGKPTDIREIARQLNVRYVLEGSVRKAKERVRINAQLVDAATGSHLWADRYDGPLTDVFTLQDDVTARIVAALKVRLTPEELNQTVSRDTSDIAAYDAFLKGWAHLLRKTPEDAVRAIAAFEQALRLDADYDRAYAALAQTYWDYSTDPEFNVLVGPPMSASTHVGYTGFISAWKFLQQGHSMPSSQAHALSARMLQRQRRFDEAMKAARQAVELGPNDPIAYDVLIENLIYSGQTEEAIKLADESIRLDPHLPGEKLFLKGLAYYTEGRSEEARASISRARSHNPKQTRYAAIQAAAFAELGETERASDALEDYLSGLTTYTTLDWIMFYWPYRKLESAERLAQNLIEAGVSSSPWQYYMIGPQDRLRGDEIESLLANRTMIAVDKSYYGGDEFRATRDRNLQIVNQDFLTYFDEGTSRIENDLLCDPWRPFGNYCVAVYRNPRGTPATKDEYVFFTLMNIFAFTVKD